MAKYKNQTDHFITFSIPQPDSSVVWLEANPNEVIEVPDLEGWRAEAWGLIKVEEAKKEEIKPKIVKPKKTKKKKK